MQNTITLQQQNTGIQVGKAIAQKQATQKIALFIAILTCIVLAVNL